MISREKHPLDSVACVGCGGKPVIYQYDYNMWYVQCCNPNCHKFDKYEFLGSSRTAAINQWLQGNRPIMRSFQKKRKKVETDGL